MGSCRDPCYGPSDGSNAKVMTSGTTFSTFSWRITTINFIKYMPICDWLMETDGFMAALGWIATFSVSYTFLKSASGMKKSEIRQCKKSKPSSGKRLPQLSVRHKTVVYIRHQKVSLISQCVRSRNTPGITKVMARLTGGSRLAIGSVLYCGCSC